MLEFITSDRASVKIRPAILEDAPSLQRNCLSTYTLDYVKNLLGKDVEGMKKGDKVRLAANVAGEIIGTLNIHFSSDPWTSHTAHISTTFVNRRFRRRGIATKMIETALKKQKRRTKN